MFSRPKQKLSRKVLIWELGSFAPLVSMLALFPVWVYHQRSLSTPTMMRCSSVRSGRFLKVLTQPRKFRITFLFQGQPEVNHFCDG